MTSKTYRYIKGIVSICQWHIFSRALSPSRRHLSHPSGCSKNVHLTSMMGVTAPMGRPIYFSGHPKANSCGQGRSKQWLQHRPLQDGELSNRLLSAGPQLKIGPQKFFFCIIIHWWSYVQDRLSLCPSFHRKSLTWFKWKTWVPGHLRFPYSFYKRQSILCLSGFARSMQTVEGNPSISLHPCEEMNDDLKCTRMRKRQIRRMCWRVKTLKERRWGKALHTRQTLSLPNTSAVFPSRRAATEAHGIFVPFSLNQTPCLFLVIHSALYSFLFSSKGREDHRECLLSPCHTTQKGLQLYRPHPNAHVWSMSLNTSNTMTAHSKEWKHVPGILMVLLKCICRGMLEAEICTYNS